MGLSHGGDKGQTRTFRYRMAPHYTGLLPFVNGPSEKDPPGEGKLGKRLSQTAPGTSIWWDA